MNNVARTLWPNAKALKTEGGALRRLREALPLDRRGIDALAVRVADGWLPVAFLSEEATWHAAFLAQRGVCVTNDSEAWTRLRREA